jgi:hypothetical protein
LVIIKTIELFWMFFVVWVWVEYLLYFSPFVGIVLDVLCLILFVYSRIYNIYLCLLFKKKVLIFVCRLLNCEKCDRMSLT